jgi:hypothetical protein
VNDFIIIKQKEKSDSGGDGMNGENHKRVKK